MCHELHYLKIIDDVRKMVSLQQLIIKSKTIEFCGKTWIELK